MDPPENIKLHLIGSPQNFWINRIYRLILPLNFILTWKYLQELKEYDIIISHLYPVTALAYLTKLFYGTKYIIWHHHTPIEYPSLYQRLYMEIIKYFDEKSFIIKNADYICSVSEFSRKLLKEKRRI